MTGFYLKLTWFNLAHFVLLSISCLQGLNTLRETSSAVARQCAYYLHTCLVPKEEPNHGDKSSDVCTVNRWWKDVISDGFQALLASTHLHLVGVETHQPLHSDLFARARVVDVLPLPQAALVHPNIRQLAKPPSLLKKTKTKKQHVTCSSETKLEV